MVAEIPHYLQPALNLHRLVLDGDLVVCLGVVGRAIAGLDDVVVEALGIRETHHGAALGFDDHRQSVVLVHAEASDVVFAE